MNNIKTIIAKELTRVFGDRKMVFSLFILPAVLVIVIYSLIGNVISSINTKIDKHYSNVYVQNAPADFDEIVNESGFASIGSITKLQPDAGITELRTAVLEGTIDLIVIFDTDFTEKISSSKVGNITTPSVKFCYNPTKDYSSKANRDFRQTVLGAYENKVLSGRLGDMKVLDVYTAEDDQIFNEEKAKGSFLAMMLPYLITILLFAGAMSLCVDAIAGEKERGTMARLLMTPASRSEIAFGKLAALSILSVIYSIIYAIALMIAMPMMMKSMGQITGAGTGLGISLSPFQIVSILLILIILTYLFVSLVSFLSLMAKDMKTASSLVSPFYIVIMIISMLTMFSDHIVTTDIMHLIPVYGGALSIGKIMTNELTIIQLVYSLIGNGVLSIILTIGVAKGFNSEKVMFNA